MIQKLIDELHEKIQECDVILLNSESMIDHYIQGSAKQSYNEAIELIKKHEPDFEDAIKKAYEDGYYDGLPNAIKKDNGLDGDAQDYYNQNYKNE